MLRSAQDDETGPFTPSARPHDPSTETHLHHPLSTRDTTMSFLFKSKAKNGLPTSALPNVSRDIRSSDGPPSQIPMMNGSKPGSPTPQQQGSSVNNSLSSLAGTTLNGGDGGRSSSAPPQEEIVRQQHLRSQQQSQQPNGGVGMGMGMGMGMGTGMGGGAGMDGLNRSGTASPNLEQKSLNFRDTSRDTVCDLPHNPCRTYL